MNVAVTKRNGSWDYRKSRVLFPWILVLAFCNSLTLFMGISSVLSTRKLKKAVYDCLFLYVFLGGCPWQACVPFNSTRT